MKVEMKRVEVCCDRDGYALSIHAFTVASRSGSLHANEDHYNKREIIAIIGLRRAQIQVYRPVEAPAAASHRLALLNSSGSLSSALVFCPRPDEG